MNDTAVLVDADSTESGENVEVHDHSDRASRRKKLFVVGFALLSVLGIGIGVYSQIGNGSTTSTNETMLPGNMFEVGLQLHQNGQYEQALMAYKNVLETDPGSAPVHYNIGQIYQVRGDLLGAIGEYDKALATNPELVPAIYNRALAYRDQGKNAEAIKGLETVVSREPNNVGALYNLGNILIAQGRVVDGTKLVNRAIELDPSLLQNK